MKPLRILLLGFLLLTFPISPLAEENRPTCEFYFSPEGRCTEAIIKELDRVKTISFVQPCSFTSAPIAKGLINVHKRGVKVEAVSDKSRRTKEE